MKLDLRGALELPIGARTPWINVLKQLGPEALKLDWRVAIVQQSGGGTKIEARAKVPPGVLREGDQKVIEERVEMHQIWEPDQQAAQIGKGMRRLRERILAFEENVENTKI